MLRGRARSSLYTSTITRHAPTSSPCSCARSRKAREFAARCTSVAMPRTLMRNPGVERATLRASPPSFCQRCTVRTATPNWPARARVPAATSARPSPPPSCRTTARMAAGVSSTSTAATRAS